jgi:hypothetical protein
VKVAVLSTDHAWIRQFENQLTDQLDHMEETVSIRRFEHEDEFHAAAAPVPQWDALVWSDHSLGRGPLFERLDRLLETCSPDRLIVILSDHSEAEQKQRLLKSCLSRGVKVIFPDKSAAAAADQIIRFVRDGNAVVQGSLNRCAVFVGSTPNIGTTVTAFGTAVHLALQSGQSVGYLCLNLKSSKLHRYLGIDEPGITLDAIRAELKAKTLTPERLRRLTLPARQVPNLHVLFGNMLRDQAEFYEAEDMEHLLQAASGAFDFFIADVSAYWDNAATVCAVAHAGTRIMVTTSQLAHFQEDRCRWLHAVMPLLGLAGDSFDLVVTQAKAGDMYTIRDIRKETGLEVLAKFGTYPELAGVLNRGELIDWLCSASGKEWSRLARILAAVHGLNQIDKPADKRWYRRIRLIRQELRT